MSVLAIIPARSGSQGIRNKNFRGLAGGASALERACGVGLAVTDDVVVTSDSRYALASWERVPDGCVRLVLRPPGLAQDDTPMIAVVQHVLAEIPGPPDQQILLLQPTQPLREPKHLRQALALLTPDVDSVVSVVEVPKAQSPDLLCWVGALSGYLCPFNVFGGLYGGEPRDWRTVPARRQDTTGGFYWRDGTVYAFWRQTVERHGTLYGSIVMPIIIPSEETCPLDTMADWAEAERRLRAREA